MRHGRPAVFNTDQGSQFTATLHGRAQPRTVSRSAWTAKAPGADNVFVERLWRSVKYEEVCSAEPRQRQRSSRIHRPLPGLLTTAADHIRASTSIHPIKPTSTPFPLEPTWQRLHLATRKICSDNRNHLTRCLGNSAKFDADTTLFVLFRAWSRAAAS